MYLVSYVLIPSSPLCSVFIIQVRGGLRLDWDKTINCSVISTGNILFWLLILVLYPFFCILKTMVLFIITFFFPWSRFLDYQGSVFYIYCVQWNTSGVKRWCRFPLIPPSAWIASCTSVGNRTAGQITSTHLSSSSLSGSPSGCMMVFSAEEGNASTVAVMNLSWVKGTKLALPAGGTCIDGAREWTSPAKNFAFTGL